MTKFPIALVTQSDMQRLPQIPHLKALRAIPESLTDAMATKLTRR